MHVMAKPSADHVGCEFVRQYYTMLNRDPKQVHRFYSKDSVFFHGGPTNLHNLKPVVGQEEIYKRIEQLKFHDCHAKILQVDSQFTIGESVVVQVCGEFSNNNEPTKKFVQTFVLAPEGSKKYHVRNDIFRYQEERFADEVSDETGEGTIDSEGDEDVIDEHSLEIKQNNFDKMVNHSEETLSDDEEKEISPMTNGSSEIEDEDVSKENGITMEAELEEVVVEKPAPPIETPAPIIYSAESEEEPSDDVDPIPDEPPEEDVITPSEPGEIPSDVQEQPTPEPGPMSWAALAAGKTPKNSSQNVRPHEPKKPPMVPTSQSPNDPTMMQKPQPMQQRMRDSGRSPTGTSGVSKDNTRMGVGRNAPDSHQVFIGNLPNNVVDKVVQDVFSKFGKIVEVRLNPKNFGFVIFDSPKPVEIVLKQEPIFIGGQEINIEEKKPSGSLGRGGRGGNSGNRGKSGGSGRGGGMAVRAGGSAGGKGNGATTPSGGGRGGGGNQRGSGGNSDGGGNQRGGNSDGGTSGRGRYNRR